MGKFRPGPDPNPPRDGDKKQARARINTEVKNGVRPHPNKLSCVDCGHVWRDGERRHEYDHHRGYGAAHHYDVEPVCTICHSARDGLKTNQTHCVNGHEFTKENTGIRSRGRGRFCRECVRAFDRGRRDAAWWRDYRARKRSAA